MRLDGHTRKALLTLMLTAYVSLAFVLPVSAENHVAHMDIRAEIQDDGALTVRQSWLGDFAEGTEIYLPLHLPPYMLLRDFRVSDEVSPFTRKDPWDINASLAQKARQYGAVRTTDGYELCFGIGSYGQRRFQMEYTLGEVVAAYPDLDGGRYRFVNRGMNTTPTEVRLELRLANGTPITEENCDVWALGFEGPLRIQDGAIYAETGSALQRENDVTLLFSFSKGILHPQRTEQGSFAQMKEAETAQESGKKEGGLPLSLLAVPAALLLLSGLIFLLRRRGREKEAGKDIKKEALMTEARFQKELPNGGKRMATYEMARLFQLCGEEDCLKMGLLRLSHLGALETSREGRGGFGKTTLCVQLKQHMGQGADDLDRFLYAVLERGAGPERTLRGEMLPTLSRRCEALFKTYFSRCKEEGRRVWEEKGCLEIYDAKGDPKDLGERERRELKEILGFRQYLQDFSRLADPDQAGSLWKHDLEYAALLGDPAALLRQIRAVYPYLTREWEQHKLGIEMAESFARLICRGIKNKEAR